MIGTNNRFEPKRGIWLIFWGLFALLGVVLVGLAFYAESYQGAQIGCKFGYQPGPCYSHPYEGYGLPLLTAGFLVALWGSAYLITILESVRSR